MRILLTNDDGIDAKGIQTLANVLKEKYEIYICAPIEQKSGYSHSVTYFHKETYVEERKMEGIKKAWTVDGTPADCAYFGIYAMMNEKPDLIISGINQGQNLAADIMYSGTIGAACEGMIAGIPAIAVSYCSYDDTNFLPSARITEKMIPVYMQLEKKDFVLSINVPKGDLEEIKGYKVTLPAKPRNFERKLVIKQNENNSMYIAMGETLPEEKIEPIDNTDSYEVKRGFVSLTPIGLDQSKKDEKINREMDELLSAL